MVSTVATLLSGKKSSVAAVTSAWLERNTPAFVGMTAICTAVDAPAASRPSWQVTTPFVATQLPWLGETDWNTTSAGNVSVSTTDSATEGPLLFSVTL